ncbi:MAG TPA: ATP-binding protein [Acidobacteriota bacterium]|nr:ATP-binding protein [Acidobacteriota bacterium]
MPRRDAGGKKKKTQKKAAKPLRRAAALQDKQSLRVLEALRASEERYRIVVETLSQGVVHQDADGTIIAMNPAAERILGKTHAEFIGSSSVGEEHDTIREDGTPFPGLEHPAMVALRTGRPVRSEIMGVYNPRRRERRWISIDAEPVFRPGEDRPAEVYTVFADITARRQAEEALRNSERLYRAIGESIDYGVWVCAPDGRNIYATDSFLKMVGLTQEECSNFGWADVLHPDDAERTIAAWKECVRTEGTWDIEHRFRGVDGAWHHVLARGLPVRNERGEIVYWAGINLDIGRLKKTEDALREREIELEEVDRRKTEFLAMLSHELRNPLTPIRNSLFILDRAVPGGEQAERAKAVLDRQVGQLARLVDDLLDVTRISRGKIKIQPEPVELAGLVHRTVEDHRSQFAAAGIELVLELAEKPLWLDGDPSRIAQAVGNLLQNASKFADRGGRVALTVEENAAGNLAVIRVRDTGIGIAPDVLPQLFQPFMQGQSTLDRSRGGLGLGLALVKGLIELHGGTVEARSEGIGKGAEFTLRLPLAPRPAMPEPVLPDRPSHAVKRVLIIEDNVDVAQSLREALGFLKHSVEVAPDGPAGLALAREFKPEVLLCDIGLPGMDGYDVAKAFRADPALRATFLVALTGYTLPEDQSKAQQAGFDRHLAKPASVGDLQKVLAGVPAAGASG